MPTREKRFFYYHFKGTNLKLLFKTWHDILSKFERTKYYWYLERTNIGHIALAAYKRKGFPLQEFSIVKKGRTVRKIGSKKKSSNGRADLYLFIPQLSHLDVNIEAKQLWYPLVNDSQSTDRIESGLRNAVKDCGDLKGAYGKKKLAILFVVPYSTKKQKTDIGLFRKNMKQEGARSEASFLAVHISPTRISTSKKLLYKDKNNKYYWYPCIAVFGKYVK
jgi:hypothetical protein